MGTDTAFQTMYRQEFIAAFEQRQSLLRATVTTDAIVNGNTCVFLVVGSGGAEAKTRGSNGLIPARSDDNNQLSCVLGEWHDLVRKTNYNVFASQGRQREIMQMTTMSVINRKTDSQILTELNTGSRNTGSAVPMTVNLFTKAQVMLGNSGIPWDGNISFVCSPAALGYLSQTPEFASAQYVGENKPMITDPQWRDQPQMYRWKNAWIISHPNVPGVGTAAEKCFMYHKSSVGHCINTDGMQTPVGYNDEQDYSWARASAYMGGKLLQDSGIIVVNHDGSALSS